MAFIARNGLWLTRDTPTAGFADPFTAALLPGSSLVGSTSPLPPDGVVQAVATGMMRLAASSNLQLYSAYSNVQVGAQGASNVLAVGSNSVTVYGDLNVRGAVNALMTSELFVRDKVLRVAVPDNSNVVLADGDLNGAGVALAPGTYDKSILWNAGAALGANFASSLLSSNAPFWEVKGGALRLSMQARGDYSRAAAGGTVSYSFRINGQEELEIVKHWTDAMGGPEHQMRVLCLGAPLAASDTTAQFTFPTSANPYA